MHIADEDTPSRRDEWIAEQNLIGQRILNFNLRLAEVDREKEEASMKENRDSNSINGTRKLVTKDKINEKVEKEEE